MRDAEREGNFTKSWEKIHVGWMRDAEREGNFAKSWKKIHVGWMRDAEREGNFAKSWGKIYYLKITKSTFVQSQGKHPQK